MSDIIVLCLILDSRQNLDLLDYIAGVIVLCLILDSRQNIYKKGDRGIRLYCALFWIQGKTFLICNSDMSLLYCALFWIQGKTESLADKLAIILYCALFWIQGKTTQRIPA